VSYTNAQFIQRVLEVLSRHATGQTVNSDDSEYIAISMDAAFAKLSALDICPTPATDQIDNDVFLPLVDYVAVQSAGKYGRKTIREQSLKDIEAAAVGDLRAINRQSAAKSTLSVDGFGRTGIGGGFNWTTGI
jgi:hypothetical protein